MNSKDRVYAALRKEPTDRVPVFVWFHPQTANKLAEILEIPVEFVDQVMGNDIKQTWVGNNYGMEGIVHENEGESHVDPWGIKWVREGDFNQIAVYPLAESSKEEALAYNFPYDSVDKLVELMKPSAENSRDRFLGCDVSPCVFEMFWRLRGMENAMLEMAMEPEFIAEMFSMCADFSIILSEKAASRYSLDWLWTGDDAASQQAMLMSPQSWREMVKPQLKRILDVAKSRGLYVAFHSCGAIRPIVPDLIEIGLDVLNPIQCNCEGMDPIELKKEFGSELAFMGGVDTQGVLPNGSADDVRKATARLIEGMTIDGGGYILAASHTVPPETPIENIFAMYEVAGISKELIFDKAAQIKH